MPSHQQSSPQGWSPFTGGQQPQRHPLQQSPQGPWQQVGQLQAPSPVHQIPSKLFPAGVGVLLLLSLATSFLKVYSFRAQVQRDWVILSKNLWGFGRSADSSGNESSGFNFDLTIRGISLSEWLVLPLATSLVLLGAVALLALAVLGERSWKTAVAGLTLYLAQLFVSLFWSSISVRFLSENARWEQTIMRYGNPQTSVGMGTWCWMLISLVGVAISVLELVRLYRDGEARELMGKAPVSGAQWIAAAVAVVCALIYVFFSLSPVTEYCAKYFRWNFGRVAGYGFVITVLAGLLSLVAKRSVAGWVLILIAHVWQVLWFFNLAIWTKNGILASAPVSQWVWLLTAVVGLGAAVYGARAALPPSEVPTQPQTYPPASTGGHGQRGPQGAPRQW